LADILLLDPLGRVFILADHTWHGHILVGHPEMRAHRRLVEQAVTSPLCIRTSATSADSRKCYGQGPRPGIYVVTVVDVALGIVKTAYLSKTLTSGDLEWQP